MYTKGIVAEQNFYEFKNLVKLETVPMKIKIPLCSTVFDFSSSFFEVLSIGFFIIRMGKKLSVFISLT